MLVRFILLQKLWECSLSINYQNLTLILGQLYLLMAQISVSNCGVLFLSDLELNGKFFTMEQGSVGNLEFPWIVLIITETFSASYGEEDPTL